MVRVSQNDELFMREALALAKRGEGWTAPNPMVGAIVVKNNHIVGRGYHRAYGTSHAEIEALRRAGRRAKGATLYVNLEPCAHFGKTPPCEDAIIRAGITRVVCATRDPNEVARGGVEKLQRAGIRVSVGVCEKEARELNEAFFTLHERKRPFIALKFAASLDGKLGTRTGDSKWITSRETRRYARSLRGRHQAILIGIETVLQDDPRLTSRTKGLRDPIRIILDSRLRIPPNARVLKGASTIIATTNRASPKKKQELERRGAHVLAFRGDQVPIRKLLVSLQKTNISSVLVEGGGAVLGSFVDNGAVDRIYAFYAPYVIGGMKAASIQGAGVRAIADALRFTRVSVERFGGDTLIVVSR